MQLLGKLKTFSAREIEKSYVSIGFECLDRDMFNPEKCYDLLAQSGVKHARCQTGWAKCEKEKGVYCFSWLDRIVDSLLQRGVQPWFNVGFGNPIYMPNIPATNPTAVGCVPLYFGDEALDAWTRYVAALASHFKDRVTHFEIWNEPDSKSFWYPQKPDGAEYAILFNHTATVIRREIPQAKIVACGVTSPYHTAFIEPFLSHVQKDLIDCFSYHAYTTIPEFRYEAIVAHMRRMLDVHGMQHVALWQGEGGYPSWAYEGHWLVKKGCNNERAQAVWQLRRYFLDVYYGVQRSSFFQMADMWEKPYVTAAVVRPKPAAHGILNGKIYTPKESYRTITNLATIFSDEINPAASYMHVDVADASVCEMLSCITLTYEKGGFPIYAYYLPTSVAQTAPVCYRATVGLTHALCDPILIDPYTAEVFAISDGISCSGGVTEYAELPLRDYPLILTEKQAFQIEYTVDAP